MKKELKIYLASPRGFCAGVKRAIEIVEKAINDSNATKINEIGKVMSLVMKIGGDRIDGKIANEFVRELLS